jgi:hypothetical protein
VPFVVLTRDYPGRIDSGSSLLTPLVSVSSRILGGFWTASSPFKQDPVRTDSKSVDPCFWGRLPSAPVPVSRGYANGQSPE